MSSSWLRETGGSDRWALEDSSGVWQLEGAEGLALAWEELCNGGADGVTATTGNTDFDTIGSPLAFTTAGKIPEASRALRAVCVADTSVSRKSVSHPIDGVRFFRGYQRADAFPNFDFFRVYDSVAASVKSKLIINGAGKVQVFNGNTSVYQSTKAFIADEWFRWELRLNSNTSLLLLRLWWGESAHDPSTGATYFETSGTQTWNAGTSYDEIRVGVLTSATVTADFDAIAYDTADWCGPAVNNNPVIATPNTTATLNVAMANTATADVTTSGGVTHSADGTLSVALANTATAEAVRSGSASLAMSMANTATATAERAASASLAVVMANTATAAVTRETTASLSVALANTATATLAKATTASLSIALGNSAAAAVTRSGSASLAMSMNNTATADVVVADLNATAALNMAMANTATATVTRFASASLSVAMANTASANRAASTQAALNVSMVLSAAAEVIRNAEAHLVMDLDNVAAANVPGAVALVGQMWPRGGG